MKPRQPSRSQLPSPARATPNARRRGAVMAETVLILPVILVLLLMLLFYGYSVTRLQRASMPDRYEAWRRVHYADGPRAGGLSTTQFPAYAGTDHINATFWNDRARTITHGTTSNFPNETREAMIDGASRASVDAGRYADNLLYNELPHGITARFGTTHDHQLGLIQSEALVGPISHSHTRIGTEWKYVDGMIERDDGKWVHIQPIHGLDDQGRFLRISPVNIGHAVRDTFLLALDEPMRQIGRDRVSGVVRGYYQRFPGYVGPDVDYHLDRD